MISFSKLWPHDYEFLLYSHSLTSKLLPSQYSYIHNLFYLPATELLLLIILVNTRYYYFMFPIIHTVVCIISYKAIRFEFQLCIPLSSLRKIAHSPLAVEEIIMHYNQKHKNKNKIK